MRTILSVRKHICSLLLLCFYIYTNAYAQEKCGFSETVRSVIVRHPGFVQTAARLKETGINNAGYNPGTYKLQSVTPVLHPIPVIFHIVIDQARLNAWGGIAGISALVDTQLAVINRDFNDASAYRSAIPAAFLPFCGNPQLSFARAQTAPDGTETPGYEVRVVQDAGFNIDGGNGSGFGFSAAKYTSSGGLDSWDPYSYLNVWVTDLRKNNTGSGYLGLTVPPSFVGTATGIPAEEQGITLSYKSWNAQGGYKAGTLTHELGHYFGLWHIWGDDNGLCPWNGGSDDGIADTPPQSSPTYDCPAFPYHDVCTPGGNGIMYMNFMDYTTDACRNMFTLEQATRIHTAVMPGGALYALTQHATLLQPPAGDDTQAVFVITPNPSWGIVNIIFSRVSAGLNAIDVINTCGQQVAAITGNMQRGYFSFDMSGAAKGIYYIRIHLAAGTRVRTLVLQ